MAEMRFVRSVYALRLRPVIDQRKPYYKSKALHRSLKPFVQ